MAGAFLVDEINHAIDPRQALREDSPSDALIRTGGGISMAESESKLKKEDK